MPSKRDILAQLSREELAIVVDQFELEVADRRRRDGLVDAIAASKRATLAEILPELPRERLKELCRTLDLDDTGKDKATIVERLIGASGSTSSKSTAPKARTKSSASDAPDALTLRPPPSSIPPSDRKRGKSNGSAAKKNGGDLGFESTLWQAADKLRNNLDAAEYKHVVLGLIFLKYISDAFTERYKQLELEVDEGADPEDPDEYRANNVFWVPQDARWEKIQANAKKPTNGKIIDDAMTAIERENVSLKGVLPKTYARPQLDKHRLGELIDLIATIGLGDAENRSKDILGRVYEYFLSEFASAEGKKGGQFYTPRSVVRVLVELLAPYKGRVFDPCCGSGGMFVQSEKFIEEHGGGLGDISI
jgi:type I restriction enzyme M protein